MYFAYETASRIELSMPDEIPYPSVSFCLRYIELLNTTERLGLWKGHRKKPKNQTDEKSLFTVRQLFDLTPTEMHTIHRCHIRADDMIHMKTVDGEKCRDNLVFTKFYMQEFMCYMYSVSSPKNFSIPAVSHSLHYPSVSYGLDLQNLSTAARGQIIVSTQDYESQLPVQSRDFGKMFRISFKAGLVSYNLFYVDYRLHEVRKLPPPYESMCTESRTEEKYQCFRTCLIESMKMINRFPSTEMTTELVDFRHFSSDDLNNGSLRKIAGKAVTDCRIKCHREACHRTYAVTGLSSFKLRDPSVMYIRVLTPESATIVMTFHAKWNFVDFVVYMGSCLGIWFGISAWSLNPVKFNKVFGRKVYPFSISSFSSISHYVSQLRHTVQRQEQEIAALKIFVRFR